MRQARVTPRAVGSLQLHGTGTALGDPVEAGAAFAAMRIPGQLAANSVPQQALVMTAVKSRIGHTEAAAGACGLLSGLHALQQGVNRGQSCVLPVCPLAGKAALRILHCTCA